MNRVAIAALALAALGSPGTAAAQESHLSAAVRLVGEGDYRAALNEAQEETVQPDSAQARSGSGRAPRESLRSAEP